ncbi:cytochrome c1 [Pseudophaeobacter arcticus]|jgi:ubiquinol-cytochrome c reductase cytochrome c1 subunit|uniref:cytochrome c1 n=1 Tax=Pseudophaeobacter arcticus TaxID=385492 RepID=UPI0004250290|nr:cytochrome c1 [Pseudophaeobacter arcticus]
MLKKLAIGAAFALALAPVASHAAGGHGHVEDFQFSFEGPFGAYDQNQLQRGLQIYTEVCSACHGLKFVPLRTLGDEGGPALPADQVRAYAAENFTVYDPELDEDVPAKPVNHFPANTSAGAPDLSLMAKARAGFHGPYGSGINQLFKGIGGAEYIASLISGYEEAPDCAPEDFTGYYNTAFAAGGYPDECKIYKETEVTNDDGSVTIERKEVGRLAVGSWIGMAPPLSDEQVEFADGHDNTVHHMAQDVAAFLMWTAEPKMMARKQSGFVGVLILTVLSVLLYLTNKQLWAPHKGKKSA